MTIRVLVWGENRHEQVEPHVREIYPDGMTSPSMRLRLVPMRPWDRHPVRRPPIVRPAG